MLLWAIPAWSQTTVNGRVLTGTTINKPLTCSGADQYNTTDTFQIFLCGPLNTWVQQITGGGGGGSPGLPFNCFQFNNAGSFGGAAGICTPDGNSLSIKGADPWADITAFGAIAYNTAGSVPTTTAACTSGSTTITTAGPFSNGWGMTILGCGATNTMATPSAVSVTPVPAIAGTSPLADIVGPPVVVSPTGSSTYKYLFVAADQHGGLTAAGAATTITTGLATLGLNTNSITSMTRSGAIITVTTTGTQFLSVGARVHIRDSTDATFSGFYNAVTVNNAGHSFTVISPGFDTALGATASATGGSANYYEGNYIVGSKITGAFKYYVCGQRPGDGALHLIGTTAPTSLSGGGYPSFWYTDWGATQLGNQTYPTYVTDAICTGAATNDYLTTTVVSGGGTNTIVVANAASQNASGQTAVFDDAPAILAAANSVSWNAPSYNGGTVYIPPVPASGGRQYFVVNSYLKLPAYTTIKQAGALYLNDTLELQTPYHWEGDWVAGAQPEFGLISGSQVVVGAANPGIYTNGASASKAENINVSSQGTNGGVLWVSDDPYNVQWSNDSFDTNGNGAGDYSGLGMLVRSTTSGGNPIHFDHVSFGGGPTQVGDASWAPLLLFPINLNSSGGGPVTENYFVNMDTTFWALRGIEMQAFSGTAGDWKVDWMYRQGGITPLFTLYNFSGSINAFLHFKKIMQDTETSGTLDLLNQPSQTIKANIVFDQVRNSSTEPGGVPPAIMGESPYSAVITQSDIQKPEVFSLLTDNLGIHSNAIQAMPGTFAFLPACSEGTFAEVTDSTTTTLGATITGGGSNKVQARCDATNWIVVSCTGCGGGGGGDDVTSIATTAPITGGPITTTGTIACPTCNQFNALTGGTNTTAAMLVGTGASLNATGTGTINSTSLLGNTWVAPGSIGATTPGTGAFTTLKSNGIQAGVVVASGTSSLGTSAITSGACATTVTATATGAATTDNLSADFNSDPSAVTGYGVNTSGLLTIYKWLTSGQVNLKVCNSTSASITPGAATLQWRVLR